MPKIKYIDRKFKPETLAIIVKANEIIDEYVAQSYDLTLRQLYYQFVSRDLIPNTQRSYDRLGSIINDARLAGLVDWSHMVDRTRNAQTLPHWESPRDIIRTTSRQFNIDLWKNQEYRPEVWIEKDALIGVIEWICTENDVLYFSCRGYNSQSEMWRAAMRMQEHVKAGQKPVILHLGDHDPSGLDMSRDILDRIRSVFRVRPIEFRRLALNMDQIEDADPSLPPNPTKITDSRSGPYIEEHGNESWELDALQPAFIERLIEVALDDLRDANQWEEDIAERDRHRSNLSEVADQWDDVIDNLDLED